MRREQCERVLGQRLQDREAVYHFDARAVGDMQKW